jgi:beta-phosphoglucomutase-like phosphatase (HAD superfamily)
MLDPSVCWALEDSEIGVRSALAAGFTVYQVPDLIEASEHPVEPGRWIVKSLTDVLIALDRAAGS